MRSIYKGTQSARHPGFWGSALTAHGYTNRILHHKKPATMSIIAQSKTVLPDIHNRCHSSPLRSLRIYFVPMAILYQL
ncbi:hypothetical protein ANACOL_01601 [Anaerotruncus colihominis DSM 17241]|uniref:Uncharacterized protein n=1 Tax=Anaerotruncus colihominis DSM 17241 TaxID=445972 RepID=B0PA33_9FIRM|nr:hypothetical protein ANACOL_01601 [Anaerotruncus colihominis DSM 17241]